MKKIITQDGSETFLSEKYHEPYHSTTGAAEEAVKKYAEPCRIASFAHVRILDVCFGLGYNSAAALDAFHGKKIEIIGLESDPLILQEIQKINPPFQNYAIIKKAAQKRVYIDQTCNVKLLLSDARESVKGLQQLFTQESEKFDVVFLDPFSPRKCPELWTEEFLSDINKIMKKGGRLATYSRAIVVRKNLKFAGFEVHDGPSVGRKSPSTMAIAQ